MSDPIVYGFPRSTFVNIIRLILTHKDVAYSFHDLEPVMGKPDHLALHPFNRVPILQARRPHRLRDERDRRLCRRSLRRRVPDAKRRQGASAHEPMDQRGQFLLLPLHDLPRDARTPGLSRTRHRLRREGRRACAAQGRERRLRSSSVSLRTDKNSCSAMSCRSRTSICCRAPSPSA